MVMTLGAQSLSRQVCQWPGEAETLDGICPPPVPWGEGVGWRPALSRLLCDSGQSNPTVTSGFSSAK